MKRSFLLKLRDGFSLIEVNMAIFVLAGGALALLGLFPLGLRESLASRGEMRVAAFAEQFMGAARIAVNDPSVVDIPSLRKVMQDSFNFKLSENVGKNDDQNAEQDTNSDVYYRGWILKTTAYDLGNAREMVEVGVQVTTENWKQNKRALISAPVYAVNVIIDTKNGH
ncbi:MAG: hypothetical protein RR007_04515 [Kiritimatiellia bacterium]